MTSLAVQSHPMARETEAKLPVADLSAIHARLLALGARDAGQAFERNRVFDDAGGTLEARGILLRIRTHGAERGGILTVKHLVRGGAFKTREEIESAVDSADTLIQQFAILGYHVAWIYEKRRRTLLWRDCVFALDECPEIGFFVEVEGAGHNIRAACEAAGLDPESHLADSYLALWKKHLAALGDAPRDMIFARDEHAADDSARKGRIP